jgi:formiminotetrahydrofolate cyclodeaminase
MKLAFEMPKATEEEKDHEREKDGERSMRALEGTFAGWLF